MGAELDKGVLLRLTTAVPRATPADRDLDLDHRLEPVQVWSIEQADLDQAHSPARIATGNGHTSVDDHFDRRRIRGFRR